MTNVIATDDTGIQGGPGHALMEAAFGPLPHIAGARWLADGWTDEAEPRMSVRNQDGRQALFDLARDVGRPALGYVSIHYGSCTAVAAATTASDATVALGRLRELVPAREQTDPDTVPVTFWSYSPHGPQSITRQLAAPTWSEIADNYPRATRSQIERLLADDFEPGRGGQLLLWHGPPGTGKTTCLRALAREWREWASVHYVADPEQFFGAHADYMLQVLLRDTDDEDQWRVLLLEDSGELIRADAKAETGQALSRFLNAVDGLIGQGLRVLVLVTTNEEIGKLHDAVARPGRCAASIEYGDFDESGARMWLSLHDGDPTTVDGRMTLAELYARVEGYEGATSRQPVGFGA